MSFSTDPFADIFTILQIFVSKSCQAFLLAAVGHLISLLGGTGRCGVLPSPEPPASHQEKLLHAVSGFFPPNTLFCPDGSLNCVYSSIFFHKVFIQTVYISSSPTQI